MSSQQQSIPTKCLHCHASMDTPIVCTGCDTLYPPPERMDYFALFQMPRRYRIDVEALERRFLAISRSIHPDYFGDKPEEMRNLSVRLAAELNEALRVLKDPVMRAGYLLEQAGGKSAAEDRGVPQAVLTEVLMLREEIEEAGDDEQAIAGIRDQVAGRRTQTLEQIAGIADQLDSVDQDQRARLRQLLNSVKYYDNLLSELPLA